MIFRQATLKDLDDIMSIENDSFPAGIKESKEIYTDRIEIFPEGNSVCEIDGKCVGCICTEIWSVHIIHEDLFMHGKSIRRLHSLYGNTFYISSFALLSKYRGKSSIALKLSEEHLGHLTKSYPKVSKQLILVGEPWKSAQATYKRYGFKLVPNITLRGYFEPEGKEPFNGLVMAK
jgi:ribosomal-protein-alanine N-acetyltransferase